MEDTYSPSRINMANISNACMYVCMYVYIYIYVCIYIYMYIYVCMYVYGANIFILELVLSAEKVIQILEKCQIQISEKCQSHRVRKFQTLLFKINIRLLNFNFLTRHMRGESQDWTRNPSSQSAFEATRRPSEQ